MPISNPPSSITPNMDSVNINLMDPSNQNTNLNPYLVVNNPVPFGGTSVPTVSKTLSLPRVLSNNFSGGGTKKRNSKLLVDAEQPVVNPAFIDGLVRPVAISDYDDPLRFIQLPPPPNFKPEVVNIKTNQQINPEQPQPSAGQISISKSIPSFRLTRNVSSTLSKVTSPVEFHTLPRQFQTDQVDHKINPQMDIPLSSFHLRDKQGIDALSSENGGLAQQRLSTASTVSNQSSNASSGDPSTTSSLYYVDCRRQSQPEKEHQRSSHSSTSMSSASSTITGSSGSSSDGQPTTTTMEAINQNDDFGEEDLPPPPDTLLRSDDEENGNSEQQTFGQRPQQQPNKSTPTINDSSNKLITQLLPPLPPSDYHSITTLQRRKQQQQQQQQFSNHNSNYHQPQQLQNLNSSQVNGDVPAYSTTTLRSFQSAGGGNSGTLRKPPPPPPPPRPHPQASNLASSGIDGCSSNASTTYADPLSISIGSSSPIDNLTMSTQPTPSPTSDPLDQHPSPDTINNHSYAQQRPSTHQTKTLFNRNSSPTYGWVYHQPDNVIRYDSSSLGDSGGSGGQPNSLESGDSRQPLSHSFDTNNNDNNNQRRNNNNFHVYRNQVFTQDETVVQDEDDGHQTKARYVDGPYKMFYDSPDDHQSGLNGKNPTNNHDSKNRKKRNEKSLEVRPTGHKEGCFRRCCRSLIIITTIALLIFMLMILGTTLYYRFVLNKPETGFSAIQQLQKYLFGEEKVISGSNSTATTPTVFTSISAAVTLFSSTFTTASIAKTKPLIPTTPSTSTSSSLDFSTTESSKSAILSSTTISTTTSSVDETSTTETTDRPITSETTTPASTSTTNEESSTEVIISKEDQITTSEDSEPAETTVQPLRKKLIPTKTMLTTEPPPATIEYDNETLEGFVVNRGSSVPISSTEESSIVEA